MPVNLQNFISYQNERGIVLQWITAAELNNEGFQVESSANGADWRPLGFVRGEGTTAQEQTYEFAVTKADLQIGRNFFRLKQMDHDGAFEYSNIIVGLWSENDTRLVVAPNPATDHFFAYLPTEFQGRSDVQFRITDLAGKAWQRGDFVQNDAAAFDLSGLPAGSYLFVVTSSQTQRTARFVKR